MHTEPFTYFHGTTQFHGYCAWTRTGSSRKPGVLIAPDWSGCNEFAQNTAREMAQLGYVGIALDMYGEGKVAEIDEEKRQLIQPLMEDRLLLQERMRCAYEAAKALPQVDSEQLAAMGFCFGGLCVLDLARSGVEIQGVVSFHGLLQRPVALSPSPIYAKVLVLHGYEDPLAPPEALTAFEREMTESGADWQVHVYGKVQHAFTNPVAQNVAAGLIYNAHAAKRAWASMTNFFEEILTRESIEP